ncbi:peptidylprolyl isomerase [Candidatus Aquiluna sp. UB-MaderosW2red]|uniref:peptidylprolyl isomerase n=1 Tax=Candidatus Aquiluna sp. UB-MaderosW2red TaxID=1855377 RepID=UPI000875E7A7|nr:peptidylprolyl isomerase [Candidatus Aquiluna sp. UB-MaderosW2red]SCX11506.1 peptidyl-prolyl cis-trans isomerase B (cyclophilin B) [Candidatus Aquiluna sp. UB-MaderosW2red]
MNNNEKLEKYQAKQLLVGKRLIRGKADNRVALVAGAAALVLAFAGQLLYFNFGPGSSDPALDVTQEPAAEAPQNSSEVPSADLAEARIWEGALNLNDQAISLELDGVNAPQAVANFISLAQSGYYENVTCHRLTTAGIFVLQCGDPDGTGGGGPGYNFGPVENAPADDLYLEGTLAMARVGQDGNSMGSQFFIVYGDSSIPSDSAGGYTVFGKITGGLDAVKAIADLGTSDGSSDASPVEPVIMSQISVK